jgi:hypothetical protein
MVGNGRRVSLVDRDESARPTGPFDTPTPMASPPTDGQASVGGAEPYGLRRFVATVAVAGGCVAVAALPALSVDLALKLLPFLVLVVLAERFTDLHFGRAAISLGAVATVAAAASGGPVAGTIAGLACGLAAVRLRALSPLKSTFNVAALALSGAAAGLPFWAAERLAIPREAPVDWPFLLLGLAGGLTFFAVNYGLLAMVIALDSGTTWLMEWRLRCSWLVVHYAIMGGVGAGLVMLYEAHGPIGLVLLLGPAGMLYYAQRQYVTHTVAHVGQLSSLNGELAGSNERLRQTLAELGEANEAMLTAFSEALELRDRETEGHCQRVVHYAHAMAAALGLPPGEVKAVVHGAMLHDIGKIGVRDAILRKPGPLTAEERAEMERHPEIGYRMIAHIPFLGPAGLLVRHHHERWDGAGYPDRLAGEAIPLGARIFAVADAFDAMTSDRPYRAALPWEVALAELTRFSGAQFDPRVVEVFTRLVADGTLRRPAEMAEPGRLAAPERVVRAARAVGLQPDGSTVSGRSLAS